MFALVLYLAIMLIGMLILIIAGNNCDISEDFRFFLSGALEV